MGVGMTCIEVVDGNPVETRIEIMAAAGLFDFYAAEAKRIYGRVLVRPAGQRSSSWPRPAGATKTTR